LSNTNKYLVVGPRWGFIPGQTGRLTVGRNIRLRLRLRLSRPVQSDPDECSELAKKLIIAHKQEYKESSCEELTQCITARLSAVINCESFKCDYSKIETVIINCNSA
jgi:hypothetical protein